MSNANTETLKHAQVVKRGLEMVMESFQGLEQLASHCGECGAMDVGKVMVSLNCQLETVHSQLERLCEVTGSKPSSLLKFPGVDPQKPKKN